MTLVAGLIIFSVLAAWLCARSRAAGPAVAFAVTAVLLFCTTPLGDGLPKLVSEFAHEVSHTAGGVADNGATE